MTSLRDRLLALIGDLLAQMAASDVIEPGLMRLAADARAVIALLVEAGA